MKYLALVVCLVEISSPPHLLGQASLAAPPVPGDVRLVDFQADPGQPTFGVPFRLRFDLRVAGELTAFLPDSLPGEGPVGGAGPGSWTTASGPGDSIDIRATYPMIAYRSGLLELPPIVIHVIPADGEPGPGRARAATQALRPLDSASERLVRIGGLTIDPYGPLADSGAILIPRPTADVLGPSWSTWLIAAVGLVSIAGLGGAGVLLSRWWAAAGALLLGKLRRKSPRRQALDELDRVHALGWHRNGRIDDFYASSTDALRRFAGELDSAWGGSLTSSELLVRLEQRWGATSLERLRPVVEMAERVKFGADRPAPDTAEGHWSTIRDWIRSAPEG